MVLTVARRRSNGSAAALVVGVLLVIGLVLMMLKWLLITALILVVPFGAWWFYDRAQRAGRGVPAPRWTPPPPVGVAPFPPSTTAGHHPPGVASVPGVRTVVPAPATAAPAPRVPSPAVVRMRRQRLSAEGRLSVMGESHYQQALRRAAEGATIGEGVDDHLPVVALLVPEPENHYDPHAVRVELDSGYATETVGYLAREQARDYQRELLRLRERGYVGTCPGRLTGGGPGRSYGVYLHVSQPEALALANLVGDADLLDPARQVTVTREEAHQQALARHHRVGVASPSRVVAELWSSVVSKGKHSGAYAVEVRLDGDRVGELTAGMSERYAPLVRDAEARGRSPRCEALVTHGERGFQMDLRLPKVS